MQNLKFLFGLCVFLYTSDLAKLPILLIKKFFIFYVYFC